MSYQAEISRANPSCFLFLIDQSGSMADTFGGGGANKRKADGVADAINRLLQNLIIKCAKSEGIRDYYHIGVIGYGATIGSGFTGHLTGQDLSPISLIANSPSKIEERTKKVDDGAGGLVDQTIKFPIWFDPIANGGTPMCQALDQAKSIIQNWINEHPSCFPPIVINITDGEATDGDPTEKAEEIKRLSSVDGNVLVFNIHVSSQNASPIEFPDKEDGLPDQFAKLLFRMSSILPTHIQNAAKQEGYRISEAARGFVFNADMVSVIRFLDIGTRPSNLR
ncbi:VWA domain-containing protein [candidate division KSB1 bacterium]|nr:VWA domain-containing protein [candidate division KSB1 bacterium]